MRLITQLRNYIFIEGLTNPIPRKTLVKMLLTLDNKFLVDLFRLESHLLIQCIQKPLRFPMNLYYFFFPPSLSMCHRFCFLFFFATAPEGWFNLSTISSSSLSAHKADTAGTNDDPARLQSGGSKMAITVIYKSLISIEPTRGRL